MKRLLFILMIACSPAFGQDVFRQYLYSPDLIFKYREKIELTDEQASAIKEIYNNSTMTYNNFKWDLDARMIKLEETMRQPSVDINEAEDQLQDIMKIESQIKRMRLQTMLRIKNKLTKEQQTILDEFKSETDDGYEIMTSVNQDPRVVVKVNGYSNKKEPLYIVKEGNRTSEVKSLSSYDPNQIESIEVLKGSSATDLYGDKGKNGVVIITLK